jgi:hypothetical protein
MHTALSSPPLTNVPLANPPAIFSADHAQATLSRRLQRRAVVLFLALLVLGILPTALGLPARWQALGLGLIIPGGGFAASGGWGYAWFALSLLLFAISLGLWVFTANFAVVVGVWLVTALLAFQRARDPVAAGAIGWVLATAALIVLWRMRVGWQHRAKVAARFVSRSAYLPAELATVATLAVPAPAAGSRELSRRELAALRYSLDRGLQPVEGFGGFDVKDQFQSAALRYQINYLHYSLALAQAHYTPSFHGYLSTAQLNLIRKMTLRRVWSYWVYESLLGNFSLNFDPISKDNIMLGGFYNGNIGMYMANTGDRSLAAPGCLEFALTRNKVYRHDARTIADKARWNFDHAVYCLYPCEPAFAYSYCNQFGLVGIHLNDRVFATDHAPRILSTFRRQFEREFIEQDGNIIPGRIDKTGFKIPVLDFVATLIGYAWLGTPHFPDIARRNYAIARREFMRLDASGEMQHEANSYDRIDIGNYRRSEIYLVANSLLAAREHGDEEMAAAAMAKLDRYYQPDWRDGVLNFNASTQIGAQLVMGHLMRKDDWRNAVLAGPPQGALRGPLLNDARYPDVLVARAASAGDNLELVLYPGGVETRQELGLERLTPGGRYRVLQTGSSFDADPQGRARLSVELHDRTALSVVPVH